MTPKYNKIMIIDDNEIDNYIVKVLLKNNNIASEILDFDSGAKAIDYLELHKETPQNLPDIIFLDIYMPLVDGFQFMELYHKIDSKYVRKCKVCIVSSSIDNHDILRSKLDKNIYTFVSKPISTEFLLSL